MDRVIETEHLSKVYSMGSSEVYAVRDVSLTVWSGEFVALMGPSGSGKSSLMHLLGCLDRPTRGAYRLEGRAVGDLSAAERSQVRNQRIGFVFQTFNLLPRLTALENVALPLLYQRPAPRDDRRVKERCLEMLARVGLEQRAGHRPVELSGGERQRVAIARALVTGPAVILADEPTGNLDSATGREIMNLLAGLTQDGELASSEAGRKPTILVVTHNADTSAYAGRVLHMLDGRIMEREAATPGQSGNLPEVCGES
jgi:putative ABC transport system ATP-binding protein